MGEISARWGDRSGCGAGKLPRTRPYQYEDTREQAEYRKVIRNERVGGHERDPSDGSRDSWNRKVCSTSPSPVSHYRCLPSEHFSTPRSPSQVPQRPRSPACTNRLRQNSNQMCEKYRTFSALQIPPPALWAHSSLPAMETRQLSATARRRCKPTGKPSAHALAWPTR